MIIVTTDGVPGKRIKRMHGLVIGNSVRARHLGRDITAGLRSLVGGEVPEYTRPDVRVPRRERHPHD